MLPELFMQFMQSMQPSSHAAHSRAATARLRPSKMQQTMRKTLAEVRQWIRRRKEPSQRISEEGRTAEDKTEKTGAVLRTSEVLTITFNPDRISQNVKHKNCRGETDIKHCRRKHRDRTSRFWDIAGSATCNSRWWNPNSAENRVWVWLGF